MNAGGTRGGHALVGALPVIAAVWGAVVVLVFALEVEAREALLVGTSLVAILGAIVAARRHASRSRRAMITPRDLWRK
jgi:hypothetical protein